MTNTSKGILHDVRIVEMSSMGPVPFAAMLMADMGAEILTISAPAGRTSEMPLAADDPLWRGRSRMYLDLKADGVAKRVLNIIAKAHVLLEGFRPGVMERLGLGPETCLAENPELVYGRMSGWGQTGPLKYVPGHDPNYLSLTGALHSIGNGDLPPVPPLNLVGDFGGGAMYLVAGVLAALLGVRRGEQGQVVDAAIVDGVASLMTSIFSMRNAGLWRSDSRESNLLDGGAPYGRAYQTSDSKYVMVAAMEPRFYKGLLALLELDEASLPPRNDPSNWPALHRIFQEKFKSRSRDEWSELAQKKEACLTPILTLAEAPHHPHNVDRNVFACRDGKRIPSPAPRFQRTPSVLAPPEGAPWQEVLQKWGVETGEVPDEESRIDLSVPAVTKAATS
jgi:alpha-methylacyl-CoA racemase